MKEDLIYMKSFNENKEKIVKQNHQKREDNKNAISEREKKELVLPYNHQERIDHIEKTVARYNATIERLKASKNGEE